MAFCTVANYMYVDTSHEIRTKLIALPYSDFQFHLDNVMQCVVVVLIMTHQCVGQVLAIQAQLEDL